MKKFIVVILVFIYFNIDVGVPVGEHFRMAQRTINAHLVFSKKGEAVPEKMKKSGSKQNVHLQNTQL